MEEKCEGSIQRVSLDGRPSAKSAKNASSLLSGFENVSSHPLTIEEIEKAVPINGPARYALGYRDARGAFRVQFVGQSIRDLKATLISQVGRYREFKLRSD